MNGWENASGGRLRVESERLDRCRAKAKVGLFRVSIGDP